MKNYLKKPIIFIGFPRSGTTIISEVILQHEKLAWVSNYQSKFPESASINLIRNVFQNRFWNIKGQKKQLNKVPLLNRYAFKPDEAYNFWNLLTRPDFGISFLDREEEKPAKIQEVRSFLERLISYQNRERLAFKTTGPSRLTYLHSIFPDAYFVRVTRKPLPTLRSLLKVGFWNKKGGVNELYWHKEDVYSDKEIAYIENLEQDKPALLAALQFYKINEVHNAEQKSCKANVHDIAYEDFIKEPLKEIHEVLRFADLNFDNGIESYLEENEIYNRNRKQKYFVGPEVDSRVLEVATKGVKHLAYQ